MVVPLLMGSGSRSTGLPQSIAAGAMIAKACLASRELNTMPVEMIGWVAPQVSSEILDPQGLFLSRHGRPHCEAS